MRVGDTVVDRDDASGGESDGAADHEEVSLLIQSEVAEFALMGSSFRLSWNSLYGRTGSPLTTDHCALLKTRAVGNS